MALLSGFDELDPSSDTFSDWVNKTNELILYVRGSTDSGQTSIMTANSLPGGSQTYGNSTLFGQFTSNTMVILNDGASDGDDNSVFANGNFGGLRGGTWDTGANTITSDTLYITSNTNFTSYTGQVNVHSTYGVYVENNIDVDGDVFFVGNSGSNTDPKMHWESDNNILNFNDDVQATWGTGDDLKVYYTGTRGNVNTDILDVRGSTNTNIFTDDFEMRSQANNELMLTANVANGVELYWDGIKKVSSNTHGVEVYGQVIADNGFVTYNNQPIEMGGANYAAAHNFTIVTDGTDTTITETSNDLSVRAEDNFRVTDDTGATSLIVANTSGEVTLYHNNNQKMQTNAYGVEITGEANTDTLRVGSDANFDNNTLNSNSVHWDATGEMWNYRDDVKVTFGDSDDFQIYHDSGNNSTYIIEEGAGDLHVQANNMQLEDTSGQAYFCGTAGLGASVHYNGDQKLITTNIGLDITGEANTDTLRVQSTTLLEDDVFFDGTVADQMHWDASLDLLHLKDNVDLYFGDGKDFHIFHDGANTYMTEMGSGELHIQANNMNIEDTSGQTYFCGTAGAGASIHYNGDQKLITRNDGVEANGIMESDTLLVTSTANFEADVYIDGSTSNNELHWHASSNTLHMKDDVKLALGDHNTFEMYHEGANTYLKENGSGDFVLQANNIQIEDTSGQSYFCGIAGAGGSVHYNGAQKLITTNIGIDVTGQVLTDTLQVDGNVDLGSANTDTISAIGEFDTALIPATATANVGSDASPWDWGYFNDINVANTATILQLEVTTLEANGVAFTGTGGDVTTTAATVIDSFEVGTTQGFKYFIHGENLNNNDSGYAVEINIIVTDNKDIYYTRYGEVESGMSDVAITPALAANTTHVDLSATCGSASGTDIHRFKVLKIETRA
jgi:hypothetical protein